MDLKKYGLMSRIYLFIQETIFLEDLVLIKFYG